MIKRRLFTPGPTPVPESAALAMAAPMIHHRKEEFQGILVRVHENLRQIFRTKQPVVVLAASGTGGVEATFVNLFSPGDTILTVNGGKFGERWVKMPKAFGLNVVEMAVPWGEAVDPEAVAALLGKHPEVKAVYVTQCETSTGTGFDIRGIAGAVRRVSDALVCVDAISSLGAHPLEFDAWGIDACISGSQKGLMIPPGLAFVALSPRAAKAMETSTMPRFYFDLRKAFKSHAADDTPWTPAISLIIGVDAALSMIIEEGIEKVWERHRRLAGGMRAAVKAAGLSLFSTSPADALTAVLLPEGVEWKKFNATLEKRYGVYVAGGQDKLKGKMFRVSHLGYYDESDMIVAAAAIEGALAEAGRPVAPGAAVGALLGSLKGS